MFLPISLFVGMLCEIRLVPGLSLSSMFFFSIGCYWALFKKDILPNLYMVGSCLICWIPLALADTITRMSCMHTLSVVCGAGAICCLGRLAKNSLHIKPNKQLQKSIFFIYAVHAILLGYISKIAFLALPSNNEWVRLILHLSVFIFTMLSSIVSYNLINKYYPKVSIVLTGGRK